MRIRMRPRQRGHSRTSKAKLVSSIPPSLAATPYVDAIDFYVGLAFLVLWGFLSIFALQAWWVGGRASYESFEKKEITNIVGTVPGAGRRRGGSRSRQLRR